MTRRIARSSRRLAIQGVDQLETRQLMSAGSLPVHGPVPVHHHHRPHHTAMVGSVHAMNRGPSPMADQAPGTGLAPSTPGFQVVPSPTITRSNLTAITTITDNDIWAVGFTSPFSGTDATLAEHFNGTSWTAVATPNPAVTVGAQLSGVAAAASNNVWAVGENVTINSLGETVSSPLIEHFNGSAWSIVAAPTPPAGGALDAVTAISASNVWAVGHLGNGRDGNLIEHFDGTSWKIVQGPATGTFATLNGVSGTSASDVWAVGSVGRFAGVQILHFNGQTWSTVSNLPLDTSLQGVVALAPNNVWAVGADIEHFDGKSWSIVPSPGAVGSPSSGFGLSAIAAASADNIYAVGGGIEHFNGTSWSIVSSPDPSNASDSFAGVTTLSNGTAIAVGTTSPLSGPNNTNGLIVQN
jgi:hypothetical protein